MNFFHKIIKGKSTDSSVFFIGFFTLFFTIVLLIAGDFYNDFVFFKFCNSILHYNLNCKLWELIVLSLFVFIVMSIVKTISKKRLLKNRPSWLKYTKDEFSSIDYKWAYIDDSNSVYKFKITNLTSYCHICSRPLVNNSCPKCNTNYESDIKTNEEIISLIWGHVEDNDWNMNQSN